MVRVQVIEYPTSSDWIAVKQRALVTVGKTSDTEPSSEWKDKIITARHSPIRRLRFSFFIENIPSCNATHLARHIHAQPYIMSQRNDRQNKYDRRKAPQDAPVNMIWDMNAEELMIICNKRLCMKADEVTRQIVAAIRDEVIKLCPEFKPHLIRMCDYMGRCPEMQPCGQR